VNRRKESLPERQKRSSASVEMKRVGPERTRQDLAESAGREDLPECTAVQEKI